MRLPNAAHEAQPWLIRRIVPDFRLLDVWALPVEGGAADFGEALEVTVASFDPRETPLPVRALFTARSAIGTVLRWDTPGERPIPGAAETSLRDRLPAALRDAPAEPRPGTAEFRPLYRTAEEWAAEVSNATVHGVLHLGWARDGERYRMQLAVYVRPRGRLGEAYLAAIAPFRHLVVYPVLLRQVGRAWATR